MRYNNYIEVKDGKNGELVYLRVCDGKIDKLTNAQVKAVNMIIKNNKANIRQTKSNDSIIYPDIITIYKREYERYLGLYASDKKQDASTTNTHSSRDKTNSNIKKTSNKSVKAKKCNRNKSKFIARNILRLSILAGAGFLGVNGLETVRNVFADDGLESQYDNGSKDADNKDNGNEDNFSEQENYEDYSYGDSNNVQNNDENSNSMDVGYEYEYEYSNNNEEQVRNLEFNYEFENVNDKEALENTDEYNDLFKLYGEMYGIDPRLLAAIGAQEESGQHFEQSRNGFAKGIMGIEKVWSGETIRAYNFDTKKIDKEIIDYDRIGYDVAYNIKVGAMIFQKNFSTSVKNRGNLFDENDLLPYSVQKYNYGQDGAASLLKNGNDWKDNRGVVYTKGDKLYIEHVLSRLDNGEELVLKAYDPDNDKITEYRTVINNYALNKGRSL